MLEEIGNLTEDKGYIGYAVMRPTPLSPVSRAMLKPPPEIAPAIRTKVKEEVCFFGDFLSVEGFPFTQQDTQLCRCAHSAAWSVTLRPISVETSRGCRARIWLFSPMQA
jgi:hypothetical protein